MKFIERSNNSFLFVNIYQEKNSNCVFYCNKIFTSPIELTKYTHKIYLKFVSPYVRSSFSNR